MADMDVDNSWWNDPSATYGDSGAASSAAAAAGGANPPTFQTSMPQPTHNQTVSLRPPSGLSLDEFMDGSAAQLDPFATPALLSPSLEQMGHDHTSTLHSSGLAPSTNSEHDNSTFENARSLALPQTPLAAFSISDQPSLLPPSGTQIVQAGLQYASPTSPSTGQPHVLRSPSPPASRTSWANSEDEDQAVLNQFSATLGERAGWDGSAEPFSAATAPAPAAAAVAAASTASAADSVAAVAASHYNAVAGSAATHQSSITCELAFDTEKLALNGVIDWLSSVFGKAAADAAVEFVFYCGVCKKEPNFDCKPSPTYSILHVRAKAIVKHWNDGASHRRQLPAFLAIQRGRREPVTSSQQERSTSGAAAAAAALPAQALETATRSRDLASYLRSLKSPLSDIQELDLPPGLFKDSTAVNEELMRKQLSTFAHISKLRLDYHPPLDATALLGVFPQLHTFTYSCWPNFTDIPMSLLDQLTVALRECSQRQLKSLRLMDPPVLDTMLHLFVAPMGNLAVAQFTSIHVDSSNMGVSEVAVQALGRLPCLTDLSIHLAAHARMDGAAEQGAFSSLQQLQLFVYPPPTPELFRNLRSLVQLRSCSLILPSGEGMSSFDDDAFEDCMKAWQRLTALCLDGFLLSPRHYLHLSHLQALRSLQLLWCPHLHTGSLAFLSQLPELRFLEIADCEEMELNDLLLNTLSHCPKFRRLDCDMEPASYNTLPHLTPLGWERLKRVCFDTLVGVLQLCPSSLVKDRYKLCPPAKSTKPRNVDSAPVTSSVVLEQGSVAAAAAATAPSAAAAAATSTLAAK